MIDGGDKSMPRREQRPHNTHVDVLLLDSNQRNIESYLNTIVMLYRDDKSLARREQIPHQCANIASSTDAASLCSSLHIKYD